MIQRLENIVKFIKNGVFYYRDVLKH